MGASTAGGARGNAEHAMPETDLERRASSRVDAAA